MALNQNNHAHKLIRRSRRKRLWAKALSALACIVVFCTTYALILPAITMTGGTTCGLEEHTHSDSCYTKQLVCTLDEGTAHVHTFSCFAEEQVLTCQEPECEPHTHSDACTVTTQILSCGLEESDTHTHSQDCFTTTVTYSCGLEETEGHTHSDSCYETRRTLICQEALTHTHSDSCYEDVLICTRTEHTHSSACYAASSQEEGAIANVVSDKASYFASLFSLDRSASAASDTGTTASVTGTADMAPLIDAVTIYKKADGAWVAVGEDDTITKGEDLKFTIDYTVTGMTLSDTVNTIVYTIPSGITNILSSSGSVYNDSGQVVGAFVIDAETNTISITFSDTYVADNMLNKAIEGSISFYATVEDVNQEGNETAGIVFSDKVTINMELVEKEAATGDIRVEKNLAEINGAMLTYTITVTSETGTFSEVTLTDEMAGGLQYLEGFTVTDKTGAAVSAAAPSAGDTSFSVTLPQMDAGDVYYITYVARPSGAIDYGTLVSNKATVSSVNSDNVTINDFAEADHTFTFVNKTGERQEDGSITWTIVINEDKQDISGWVLKDLMYDTDGSEVWYEGQVTLADSSGNTIQTTLPYTFPKGSADTYTVTYTTTHDTVAGANHVTNIAGLFIDGTNDFFQDYDWIDIGTNYPVTKEGSVLGTDSETGKVTIQWTITLNTAEGPLPALSTIQDKLDSGQYMTYAQLCAAFSNASAAIEAAGLSPDWAWATAVVDGTTTSIGYDVITAEGADSTYNCFTDFTIRIAEEVPQGTIISFSVEATADEAPDIGYFQNRVNVNYNAEYTARVEYGTGKPSISKYGVDPNNNYALLPEDTTFDYDALSEVNGEKTLWWRLRMTLPASCSLEKPTEDETYLTTPVIIIQETLPEGMELVGTIAEPIENPSARLTQYPDENGYALFNWYDYYLMTMQVSTGEDGRQLVTYGLNYPLAALLAEDPDPFMDLYVVAGFSDEFSWGDPDAVITQVPFANTATVQSPGGDVLDTDGHTFHINYNRNNEVVSKTGALNQQNELEYSVILNEKARDLDPDNSTINVQDVLTYLSPEGCPIHLQLKPGSVAIYDYTDGVRGDLLTTVRYTYSETSSGDGDITYTHTLNLVVPDAQAMLLEYVYTVDGTYNENYSYDMINTCTITGVADGSISGDTSINIQVYDANAEANVTGIYIYKVDENNHGLYLPGAVFNLYTWDSNTGQYVRVKHPDTDGSSEAHYAFTTSGEETQYGYLVLNAATVETVAYNTAYCLVEVTPPSGYFRNPDPYYFYIYNTDTDQNPYNLPTDFAGDKLTDGALIYYVNEPSTTEITVKKKWTDHNGSAITITADQVPGITIELWRKLEGTDDTDMLFGTYTVTPDEYGYWALTVKDLPKGLVDPEDGTRGALYLYYIKEVSVSGYTVDSYVYDDGNADATEASGGINTGTITVTNRETEGYELPKTGGFGTYLYATGGLLLMAGAILLYIHIFLHRKEYPLSS